MRSGREWFLALVLGVLVFTASRRTAQSLVPRAAAGLGGSGSLSMTRKR